MARARIWHDDRGDASGTVVNAALTGSGLTLAEARASIIDLQMISFGLASVREVGVPLNGGTVAAPLQLRQPRRAGEGESSIGSTKLMLSPLVMTARSRGLANAGANLRSSRSAESLGIGTMQHVALVFDDDASIKLFDGAGSWAVVEGKLEALNIATNWPGARSSRHASFAATARAAHLRSGAEPRTSRSATSTAPSAHHD